MSGLLDLVHPLPLDQGSARDLSARLADTLAVPPPHPDLAGIDPDSPRWDGQSLSCGHPGIAILHGTRARDNVSPWSRAAAWFAAATKEPLAAAGGAGLWHGAPALGFALHAAALPEHAAHLLKQLDHVVTEMVQRQLGDAAKRMAASLRPVPGEFDLVRGLTGLGAYLLARDPSYPALRDVLACLVRLTVPIPAADAAGTEVPGWWTLHMPVGKPVELFADGYSDQGMAHGISGPLALLSLAYRARVIVPGQAEAIATITSWLDRVQQVDEAGPWWPERLTLTDLRTQRSHQDGPARPSWCYGTPGIARALQLAALAQGDSRRQRHAEHALLACVTDHHQLDRLADLTLCHGWSGLITTVWTATTDSLSPMLGLQLSALITAAGNRSLPVPERPGLIDGTAGLALTQHSIATGRLGPWTNCLLLTGTEPT
ncbi:lanthionine synthetase C family protein [Actinomadura meridiana]|uniref:Lanthionine synthetase C family protein n=1 Tax=Actinomadura meridiana TaxID=559626 RepID=A0ABP8CH70_9ACTN